jgi:hypothetical protein
MATKPKMAAKADSNAALRVVSKSPMGGFRRAGFLFGKEPTVLRLADLTVEQEQAIREEAMLDVTDTTQAAPAEEAAKT